MGNLPAGFEVTALAQANFGACLVAPPDASADTIIAALERHDDAVLDCFYRHHGFLLLRGMTAISADPALLVRLSKLFGNDVEDYTETGTPPENLQPGFPEILLVSNIPPARPRVPARPQPPLTADGDLPVQFPHRRGWHTDQSYRRPPPDISLFYCEKAAPADQAQTLYADGIAAYAALPAALKKQIADLQGLHVAPGKGRAEFAVRAGETPQPLGPLEQPQRQPVVRHHPVTGVPALYLCEAGQMDWIDGPFTTMEKGPDGAGATLLYRLMTHYTAPEFTYVHEWSEGDLVIYDNRSMIHAATWYDADVVQRRMWRTTVRGNPGELYAGEAASWRAE